MAGSLSLQSNNMPQIMQLLHASANELGSLLEDTELPWGIKNYIALEPLQ